MKTIELGLPCSPSTPISQEEIKVKKVILCYGQNTETLHVRDAFADEGFIKVEYFNLHERDINLNFVVSVEEIRVVKIVTDVTAHRNFNKTPSDHVDEAIETGYYEIKDSEDWSFKNSYISSRGARKIILSK